MENIPRTDKGLEAILFTAEGDMRNALNNLQSTYAGFGLVNETNVFKVCDQPHPYTVRAIVQSCVDGKLDEALNYLKELTHEGYASVDIVGTIFRVVRSMDLDEALKLDLCKVRHNT